MVILVFLELLNYIIFTTLNETYARKWMKGSPPWTNHIQVDEYARSKQERGRTKSIYFNTGPCICSNIKNVLK